MENEGLYFVYMHVNKINDKKYIGITKNSLTQRFGCNGKGYMNHDTLFCRAIKKYGWDNFSHIIIAQNLTEEEAGRMEQALIEKYNTTNPEYGYNHERGGLCNNEFLRRQNISNSLSNEKHPFYGRHHTEETKEILREKSSGENNYWYNKHLSEEHRDKISKALVGNTNYISAVEKQKKKIQCVETGAVYESLNFVERKLGIPHASISNVLHGITDTAGGYHWIEYKQTCS